MNRDASPVLQTHNISKTVHGPAGKLTILHNTDLLIESGDSVAIVGPSGSGKTTLIGLLAGLDLPTEGQVIFRGTDLSKLDEDARADLRAAVVGFVFQSFHLLSSLTALENVMLPLELVDDDNAPERAREILGRVGLADRMDHYPNQLSGGEKQRVAIARAFAGRPSLLFADEPTGNLDTETGQAISDLLFDLNEHHETTLVLVTHDAVLAERCKRRFRLEGGWVYEDGRGSTPAASVTAAPKGGV